MRFLFLCLFIFLSFVGYSQKPKVVCSASMIADMTQQIGKELIEVQTIVPIGGDPHLHEPTPRDAKMVSGADLIFVNGLTFEGWLNELIQNAGTNATVVTVTKDIKPIESLTYSNSVDPHAWMDASLGLIYIKNIKNALVELMPAYKEQLEVNYEKYRKELVELDRYIEEHIKEIPKSKRILVTTHDAFQYYGRRYGIQLEAIQGTSTDAEVRTVDISRVTKVIREQNLPAVFIESTVNPKLLKQIAIDNRVIIGGSLYADSIGDKDSPAPTYVAMLKYNTKTIVKALTEKSQEIAKVDSESPNYFRLFLILGGFILLAGIIWKRSNGRND